MNKIVPINKSLAFRYVNYRRVKRDTIDMNNERYEGYMRSDFSVRPETHIDIYDRLEIVRIT